MARLRRQFDTDCNPHAVYEGIASLNETVSGAAVVGTRLPGCFDGFETAVRAVLGQQVSVAAANKLAARIVATCGIPIDTGIEGLERVFPTPDDILALRPIEEALGELGVIKARARTIAEVARLACSELDFNVGAVVSEQTERLLAVKGIGPWTANYLAMREDLPMRSWKPMRASSMRFPAFHPPNACAWPSNGAHGERCHHRPLEQPEHVASKRSADVRPNVADPLRPDG